MPLLFSYGTLQDEHVQRATFGRPLQGRRDEIVGFASTRVAVEDSDRPPRTTHYANAAFTGRSESRVSGIVFEITEAELAAADRYEQPASYVRVVAPLASGNQAWVYVHRPATRI